MSKVGTSNISILGLKFKVMKLRENQIDPVNIGIEFFKQPYSVPSLMVEPVAFGKSIVIAHIAKEIEGKTIILQPSKELLEQNYEKLVNLGGKASIYSASMRQKEFGDITYATIGSICKIGNKFTDCKNLIIDECFPYNTQISTENRCERIGTLYNKFIKGIILPKVKTYNLKTKKFEFKKIKSVIKRGDKRLLKLRFSHRRNITCTDNHLFLTNSGWRRADSLIFGDTVISSTKEKHSKSDFIQYNADQLDVVAGSCLGDSYFHKRCGKFSGRITCIHGMKQSNYIEWKAKLLSSKTESVLNNGYSQKSAIRFTTPTFYDDRNIKDKMSLINSLNLKQLAIIWMDDGSLGKYENNCTLFSCANSQTLVQALQRKLTELGITDTVIYNRKSSSTKKPYWCIGIRKLGTKQLMSRISIYVHKSMAYKIPNYYKKRCGTYEWNSKSLPNVSVFISSLPIKSEQVYDIQVLDNHNFIVCSDNCRKRNFSADGIVVHNCDRYPRTNDSMLGKFLKESQIKKVLGFTATPFKLQTNSMNMEAYSIIKILTSKSKHGNFFKNIIHITQIQDIIKDNYWAKLEYEEYDFDTGDLIYNSTQAEYTDESIERAYNNQNIGERIVDKILDINSRDRRRSIIVFVPSVAEAQRLAQIIPSSVAVYGNMPRDEREIAVHMFKSQQIQVAINVNVFSIGFDYPEVDCVILGRPTASLSLSYQQCGRGTRIHPAKKNCLIIDFVGNTSKFGRIEDLHFKKKNIWKLYGTGGRLLTGVPIHAIGDVTDESENEKVRLKQVHKEALINNKVVVTFGKFNGKLVHETPQWWRDWALKNLDDIGKASPILAEIRRLRSIN
jgi:DNA repair protein RadD